jgi:hypothetical protein
MKRILSSSRQTGISKSVSIQNCKDYSRAESFTYDELNRILAFTTSLKLQRASSVVHNELSIFNPNSYSFSDNLPGQHDGRRKRGQRHVFF